MRLGTSWAVISHLHGEGALFSKLLVVLVRCPVLYPSGWLLIG